MGHSSSRRVRALLACSLAFLAPAPLLAQQGSAPADTRPLSPAQIALFETPHLRNIPAPETLRYTYRRTGPGGFADSVDVHVRQVNPDGSKDLTFDFLSGAQRMAFPGLDHFRGNPLLMLVLEQDVRAMKEAVGLSSTYFRNRIREAFVDAASVSDGSTEFQGKPVPAKIVSLEPFRNDPRLERIASLQAKRYTFVLADAVPGMIAEIRIETPEDPALHAPSVSSRITFAGVEP